MKKLHHILIKTPLIVRVVSLYVMIAVGAGTYISIAPPVRAESTNNVAPTVIIPVEPAVAEPEVISGLPRKIELPRIGLVHEVIDGYYDTIAQDWTLTDDKTQYAVMTEPVNDKTGQTMIYGHNTSAVLEPVRLVQLGDELLVTADNGRIFVYTYTQDRFVDPADVSVLYETPETPRVVLMTCEGWFSTTRRLLYFDFKEVR